MVQAQPSTKKPAPNLRGRSNFSRIIHDNGLTLVLVALFLVSFIGQAFAGHLHDNAERALDGQEPLSLGAYLVGGAFLSSVFENWESEFLQMWPT